MFFLYVIIILKGIKKMIIPNNFAPAMLITLFAGLSTAIGGGIPFIVKKDNYSLSCIIERISFRYIKSALSITFLYLSI